MGFFPPFLFPHFWSVLVLHINIIKLCVHIEGITHAQLKCLPWRYTINNINGLGNKSQLFWQDKTPVPCSYPCQGTKHDSFQLLET